MTWLPVQRLLAVASIGASSSSELSELVAAHAGIDPRDVPFSDVMGVPITFLDKYNPDQFEIVGGSANGQVPDWLKRGGYAKWNNPFIGLRKVYQRIFIRRTRAAV